MITDSANVPIVAGLWRLDVLRRRAARVPLAALGTSPHVSLPIDSFGSCLAGGRSSGI